jgi:putative intracellular protease/amidase
MISTAADLPVHFALLLFPSYQALDVFGPLDALNTIKRQYPSLPLRLSILSSTLSPVSTLPSSSSGDGGLIPFEQQITPTHTFTSPPAEPIDILFIPGGLGTRLGPADEPGWKPLVEYLNTFFSTPSSVQHLKGIFTVCTGSFLLGRSKLPTTGKGTLDGVRATTNKRGLLRAKDEMRDVLWEPKARWVRTDLPLPGVHSVKLWTTSGVSAGTDGIFALIEEEYGAGVAEFIAGILEYERKIDPNDDPFAVQL